MRGSESQRVIEQISQGAFEQVWVGMNLSVAAAIDRNMVIVRDHLIERCDFFYCCTCVEPLSSDRFTRRIHARDKKQIVHDPGKPFAFDHGGFDGLAIFNSGTLPRESN